MAFYSEVNTFDKIVSDIMAYLPSDVDTREGSVIYNAVAGVAGRLTELYTDMDRFQSEIDPTTATRDGLERACLMRGISPFPATQATVEGRFSPAGLELTGQRFSLGGLVYVVTGFISTDSTNDFDKYQLQCETAGEVGNVMGDLVPLLDITGLTTAAITDILIPGEDEESDEALRSRYLSSFEAYGFGGNIADYREKVNSLSGVGDCKVYPAWNGGGTVKVIIVSPTFGAPEDTVVDYVQNELDPVGSGGTGVGTAPIGHTVTVVGAQVTTVNVTATLTFASGYVQADVIDDIKAAIAAYCTELNSTWSTSTLIVRIAQIESRILDIPGIVDIASTTINGTAANLTITGDKVAAGGTFNGV